MMKSILYSITLCGAICLCGLIDVAAAQPAIESGAFDIEYRLPDVPQQMTFAGEKIDLTRYDMYERFEREMTTACYMHGTTMLMIKRANRYMPIIMPILEREKIPADFIYLAAIESSFNPLAVSPAKAAGIWQFMPATAREYGLEVNSDIDERFNIEKATVAACKYLRNAYNRYGSWVDAAAAYNAGLQRISGEREKQGVESALDMYLVEETSRYIFRILAMKEMFTNPAKYGFRIKENQLYQPIEVHKIAVDTTINDLASWAKRQGATYKELKDFNPWLRTRKMPDKSRKKYIITLPKKEDMYYTKSRKYKTYNKNWVVK